MPDIGLSDVPESELGVSLQCRRCGASVLVPLLFASAVSNAAAYAGQPEPDLRHDPDDGGKCGGQLEVPCPPLVY